MTDYVKKKLEGPVKNNAGIVDSPEREGFYFLAENSLNYGKSSNSKARKVYDYSTSSSSNENPASTDRKPRIVKRERVSEQQQEQQDNGGIRFLRSRYRRLQNDIKDESDNLMRVDSGNFDTLFKKVDDLHQLVQNPREQVVDAEAFLGLTTSLMSSVKSQTYEGVTPAEFVSRLILEFGKSNRRPNNDDDEEEDEIGRVVSPIFMKCIGFTTMVGPMNTELKHRKAVVQRKRTKPTEKAQPEEVDDTGAEEKTDTDKNMKTMFSILVSLKRVRQENLILNRRSFAQTVENLFTLSFLVKDGRAEITVDNSGSQFVSPKNAPAADSVMSGKVAYRHFVFRYDFKDWKLMMGIVPDGEELMPQRENIEASQVDPGPSNTQGAIPTTPIRKLSRNRGLVIQEESVVEDSPEADDKNATMKATGLRSRKRRLN